MSVIYDAASLGRLWGRVHALRSVQVDLYREMDRLRSRLHSDEAVEFLYQGVGRRLGIVTRCVRRIFELYPPDQEDHLSKDALDDLAICLHAFFINVAGVFDNLGWVYALEHGLVGDRRAGKLDRQDIGLLQHKTQEHLPCALRDYARSDSLRDWHSRYSKIYRDALAHRIPLYVPPAVLNIPAQQEYGEIENKLKSIRVEGEADLDEYDKLLERQSKLGEPSPFFVHSSRGGDPPMMLHAQVVCDHMTVEEAIRVFCQEFDGRVP